MYTFFWAYLYALVETPNEIQRGFVSFLLHPTPFFHAFISFSSSCVNGTVSKIQLVLA